MVSHRRDGRRDRRRRHLLAAWNWLETNLGPYRFGSKVGGVSVPWPLGFAGGMEHHPFFHVDSSNFSDENTQIHESTHGWFGDGIRIACWEDFVLSEGTVSYLAGHIQDVLEPAAGSATWSTYATELAGVSGTDPAWPDSCGQVDVLKDNLYTNAPYMRGAFFYRAVALKIGADQLDAALKAFYTQYQGTPAHMTDMLATIHTSPASIRPRARKRGCARRRSPRPRRPATDAGDVELTRRTIRATSSPAPASAARVPAVGARPAATRRCASR